MKIIIVGKDLIVQENYGALCKDEDKIKIDMRYLEDKHLYKFEVQFNDGEWQKVVNEEISLTPLKKESHYVIIRLKMVNQATGKETIVETDQVTVTDYCYLGKPLEEVYPRIIANLVVEVKQLKERIRKLEEEGDIL